MCRRKIFPKFRSSKRSSAHGSSSPIVTPSAPVPEIPGDILPRPPIAPVHGSSSPNVTPSAPVPEIPGDILPRPPIAPVHGSSPNVTPSAPVPEIPGDILPRPPIAPPDVPSSSTPSSSVLKEPDHTKRIRGAAGGVDPGNVNADLNDLSNYISQYLAFIKGGEKPTAAKFDRPDSQFMTKLKEVTSGAAVIAKDFCPDAKTIAQKFLQGMGGVHMLMTGFLVVGNIMERYETVLSNKEECVLLLERMYNLIQEVDQIRDRDELMKAMEDKIKEAIGLIIDVSVACCNQIARSTLKKFFATKKNKQELQRFQTRLTEQSRGERSKKEVRSLRKLSLSGCVSLEELPDSFSQLKYLEDLNLSGCVKLVRLCADFKELSLLRVLSLKDCQMLKNLPENFHGLRSLKHLYLSNCVKLAVRSMESIVEMETLQFVDIQGSPLLHEAWQNFEKVCNKWSHKVVRTSGQGSSNEESVERNDDMQE